MRDTWARSKDDALIGSLTAVKLFLAAIGLDSCRHIESMYQQSFKHPPHLLTWLTQYYSVVVRGIGRVRRCPRWFKEPGRLDLEPPV